MVDLNKKYVCYLNEYEKKTASYSTNNKAEAKKYRASFYKYRYNYLMSCIIMDNKENKIIY